MKASVIALCALFFTASLAAKSLDSGNVLTTMAGANMKSWGTWIGDLIGLLLSFIPMFWCSLMGFFGGLGGDNLTPFQTCWAGWFIGIYGGKW